MKRMQISTVVFLFATICALPVAVGSESWVVDTQDEWQQGIAETTNVEVKDGVVSPTGEKATLQSTVRRFEKKQSAQSIVFEQSSLWQNWRPIANLGPSNLADAPVLLSLGPANYWMFGRYSAAKRRGANAKTQPKFQAQTATLDGFDIPLKTTPFANQFDAPGGLKPRLGGYHAWQSRDMVNWVHHGPVTENFSRWVTSAEHIDGKTLIYYDFPNDQDPHVYVDEDLTDGLPGENKGKAVDDPSHGSDAGFIRDLDGNVHVIFENWDPIDASKRSWDSPLAGHAVSPNGVDGFIIQSPAVDNRTKPTGEIRTYKHPHWVKEDPKNYKTSIAEYEVHTPEQEAYGDWASICIGGRYYLFGDYDPVGGHSMSACWFTSPSIDQPFTFCDHIGKGHPDPDVCFAEGKFYLATQMKTDYVSDGPWVESVETRVGVDTTGDGNVDVWSDWMEVREAYDYTPGFSKQVAKEPASVDLSELPEGFGFQFEVRLTDTTENKSKPMLDKISISFR
ncbi:hypothetical protein [Novipirellula herctigrandis]